VPDMRRDFANRDDLIAYLRAEFPDATEPDAPTGLLRGGRAAAEEALSRLDPPRYAATRNYLDGAVSRLGPYLRHGVLTLAEVRDAALQRVQGHREGAEKFVNELAWRDYYERVVAEIGDGIWRDQEPYKTGRDAREYAQTLPEDVARGETTLVCMDAISDDLRRTGYLHNHQRLWMAAYLVHWRRVRWQAAARWFLQHLLCGAPAANNLSFQWVASTFAAKPYIFNREALEKFTGGAYCHRCPHYRRDCPFEGSYDELTALLFPRAPDLREGGEGGKAHSDAPRPRRDDRRGTARDGQDERDRRDRRRDGRG